MLFDMLTADAASKHGHEFSERQPNPWPVGPRRSPLRVLPYAGRPRLPVRPRSTRGAVMDELKEEPEEPEILEKPAYLRRYHDRSVADLQIPGAFLNHSPPEPSSPQSTTERPPSPGALAVEDNDIYEEAEDGSLESPSPEKRSRRSKSQYSLAHPPPSSLPLRKQAIIRPRILLQLQSLSTKFHKPVFEVSPLSRFDCSKKSGKRLSRFGKGKVSIANEDLAVLKVGDHNVNDLSPNEATESSDSRDIIGIISPLPYQAGEPIGRVQIILDDVVWRGTPSRDGRYDLQCLGTDVVSARWYVPKAKRKQADASICQSDNLKFYFAAILPQTKKHPTLASLSQHHLDIYDSYTVYPGSSLEASVPSLSLTPNDIQESSAPDDQPEDFVDLSTRPNESLPVDESHRKLIIVSAFWVMLCERWSPYYSFPTAIDICASSTTPPINRSMSLPIPNDSTSKIADSCISIPRGSASPALEHQSTSGRSSVRSVSVDASMTGPRRMLFSSLSFGRSHTPDRLPKVESVDAASHPSLLATSTQTKPDYNSVEENIKPSSTEDKLEELIQDPTAQFRHLLSLTSPSPEPPSRPPVNRLGSITQRKTITLSSGPDARTRRGSRSISWNWNRTIPSRSKTKTQTEHSRRHSALMTHNNAPLLDLEDDLDVSLDRAASPSGPADTISITEDMTSSANDASLLERPFDEEATIKPTIKSAGEDISPSGDVEESKDVREQIEVSIPLLLAGQQITPSGVFKKTNSSDSPRRLSADSSDIDISDIEKPYWKEFDRLQTTNFWQRAHQLQNTSIPQVDPSALLVENIATKEVQLESTPVNGSTGEESEMAEATISTKKGWLNGLRHMGRRNHG